MRTIRVWFEKQDDAKFISHLDLNRYMPRAVRRANIPAWYTEGFNKHLYIYFAVPLSLGFESRNDCFEIRITDDDFTDQQVLSGLQLAMPKGIKITSITEPEIQIKLIRYAKYDVFTDLNDVFVEKVKELFLKNNLTVMKKSKSGVKPFDLSSNLYQLSVEAVNGQIVIHVTLPAGCVDNVNPTLLLQAISNELSVETDYVKIIRNGFLTEDFNDFK